jgi:hypothetical protein
MKSKKETQKKNEQCVNCGNCSQNQVQFQQISANEIIAENAAKRPILKKIWFWLTCWRPITKYELAKREQAWLKVGIAVVNNYNAIQMIIKNMNRIVLQMQSTGMIHPGQPQEDENKKDGEKKGDVMYG